MLSTRSTYPRESAGDDEDAVSVAPMGFNTVGVQMSGSQARLLFGVSPYSPRVTVPLARVALSGDIADLVGYLNTTAATINTFKATSVDVFGTTTTATLNASTVNSDYANLTGATIDDLTAPSIETESITTNGTELVCDWNNFSGTKLPSIALINNPFSQKNNSDGTKSGFKIESVFIGAAEGLAGDALLYLAKAGGGWLLNAAQGAFSAFNGYMALGEGAMSIGADAASFGTAAASEAAIFEAGEGMVLASSASEAASLFSSAGVLAEGGVGWSTELGEIGESLLQGIENSSGSFVEEAAPNFYDTLLGSARWVSL